MTAEFEEAIAPLYRQFGWKLTDAEKSAHMLDRYKVLKDFRVPTLTLAVAALLGSETRMPPTATVKQACLDSLRRANAQNPVRVIREWEYDSDACPCGCGGKRWAKIVRATPFPPEYPNGITRDHMHCAAKAMDIPPAEPIAFHDQRGIPVYA